MKKMVAKKATKKYNNGGDVTMKDKTNTVVRDKDNSDVLMRDKNKSNNSVKTYSSEVNRNKDNSRMKSTTDNSVANIDKGKVKYKIAKGATVNFTAKSGRTIKKAQGGMPVPSKDTITTTNPRKGFTSNTQPVNSAGEVTTGMDNPYKPKTTTTPKPRLSTGFKNGGKMKKAKNGAKFPDLNKDGKVTRADILKGRGVIAKNGKPVKKAALGALLPLAMKAAPMIAGMLGGMKKKNGGSMKKCRYGCK